MPLRSTVIIGASDSEGKPAREEVSWKWTKWQCSRWPSPTRRRRGGRGSGGIGRQAYIYVVLRGQPIERASEFDPYLGDISQTALPALHCHARRAGSAFKWMIRARLNRTGKLGPWTSHDRLGDSAHRASSWHAIIGTESTPPRLIAEQICNPSTFCCPPTPLQKGTQVRFWFPTTIPAPFEPPWSGISENIKIKKIYRGVLINTFSKTTFLSWFS